MQRGQRSETAPASHTTLPRDTGLGNSSQGLLLFLQWTSGQADTGSLGLRHSKILKNNFLQILFSSPGFFCSRIWQHNKRDPAQWYVTPTWHHYCPGHHHQPKPQRLLPLACKYFKLAIFSRATNKASSMLPLLPALQVISSFFCLSKTYPFFLNLLIICIVDINVYSELDGS